MVGDVSGGGGESEAERAGDVGAAALGESAGSAAEAGTGSCEAASAQGIGAGAGAIEAEVEVAAVGGEATTGLVEDAGAAVVADVGNAGRERGAAAQVQHRGAGAGALDAQGITSVGQIDRAAAQA